MAPTQYMVQKRKLASSSNPEAAYPFILAGAAVAFFFTQGLPLWNDDYTQWIAQAQGSLVTLIARILLPITWAPESWGDSDRPVEVLVYKILHGVFGHWGTGYFFIKSLGFGALCWTMRRWMRKLGVSHAISWLALGIFALSANGVASLIWLSDFGVCAQLILALVLLEAASDLHLLTPSSARFKRAFALFFGLVYFGSKIRGDLRLAPLILLTHLYFYDRKRLKIIWPWLTGTFLATLPWSLTIFKHLGWTYGVFSFRRTLGFFAGDALNLRSAPISLLGAVGLLSLAAALAGVVQRVSQDRFKAPGKETGLLWIWLGFSVLSLGLISPQNPTFEFRHTLIPLVPATLLLAHGLESTLRGFSKLRGFRPALLALLALQCAWQFRHAVQHRIDMGHTMVGIDGIYATVEAKHPDAQFVLGPGFLNYGFSDSPAQAIRNRQALGDLGELSRFPPQNTYVASWTSSLDTQFAVDAFASGCAASAFDRIFGCGPSDGAFLLKYVGSVPEVGQADAADKRGDLKGASEILKNYWIREPGNHGVAFILGLDDYRLGNFSAMEEVYDSFAPYFPNHASVVYNWALAKMGVAHWVDASRLFERAYALAPGDYGIGFNLADTYYKMGKRSRALATVNELLRAYPQNEALTRAKQHYSSGAGNQP